MSPTQTTKRPVRYILAFLAAAMPMLAGATTLEVRGTLVATTCVIQHSTGPIVVALGAIPLTAVNRRITAARTPFMVTVRCPGASGVQKIGIRFSGPLAADMRSLALTARSTAKGVGVVLFDEQGTEIELGRQSTRVIAISSNEEKTLHGTAAFRSTGSGATAGTANAEGELTLIYH